MAYRPKYKASDGTLKDLPIDAETVNGKTPLFSTEIKVSAGSNINSVGTPSVSYSNGTFTFNYLKGERGPKGDKGDTGATGATGPQGPKGDTGAKGEAGCSFSLRGTTLTITWNT